MNAKEFHEYCVKLEELLSKKPPTELEQEIIDLLRRRIKEYEQLKTE